MTINIRSVQMDLTDAIRAYVEEKMQMLEKFGSIMHVDVECGRITEHHQKGDVYRCRATVDFNGEVVTIEREAEDLYKAIDKVKDHLRETLAQKKDRDQSERRQIGTDPL